MKKLSILFLVLAIILSDVMCAVVSGTYVDIVWGIKYAGYSAPVDVAFIIGIPYLVGVILLLILSYVFYRKSKKIASK